MLLSNGFSTVNWLWLFSAIFIGSVPLLLQIRNYNKTGSKDYLLFAGIFLLSAYIWFIGSIRDRNIDVFTHKSIMITFYLLHFLIILHASRLRWKTSPLVIIYPSMLGLIIMEMIALFSS